MSKVENEVVIKDIDFNQLRNQKAILFNMILDWGEADDEQQQKDAKEAEGLMYLLDAIQEYAVDELGMDEKEVFDLEGD